MHQNGFVRILGILFMSNYRRADVKGGTYFFTLVTFKRQKILCENDVRSALREGIQRVRLENPFHINAWVLLPDHLHCIWTLPSGDHDYSLRWAKIKRFVSKQCKTLFYRDDLMNEAKQQRHESTVWQRRFWEHLIRDAKDMRNHMDYIHYNPVKHNMVASPKEWQFSTFHGYVKNKVYDENWGSGNMIDIQDDYGE